MNTTELRSRSTIVVGIVIFVLFAASISGSVYISTLENNTDTTGSGDKAIDKAMNGEVYTSTGALRFSGGRFEFQGQPFRIISGAIHYFRTVPGDWEDRLIKLKACGMNTVETYVPWNLHEEYPGLFDYGGILNIRQFIKQAQTLGLYVIVRPGPYICSEWDFGGLPAWLLRDPEMKVRTTYPPYHQAVERFFDSLLPLLTDLQHSEGGPIIAFQVENEYGSFSSNTEHLEFIRQLFIQHGLKELLITSDNLSGINKDIFYKYALPTANFKEFGEGRQIFDQIHNFSSEFPLMVTEFWTGWFDHWTSQHSGLNVDEYAGYLTEILEAGASINFYMFHGGTNFGFMNGANKFEGATYKPDVSSYDYDALLSEAGDITPKYLMTRELLQKYIYDPKGINLPDIPQNSTKTAYGKLGIEGYISFETLLSGLPIVKGTTPVPMEMLPIHGDNGQNYGYILYRTYIKNEESVLHLSSLPQDRAQVYIEGEQVAVIDWKSGEKDLSIPISKSSINQNASLKLDIFVENHGRVNYGTAESGIFDNQRKGLNGSVFLNDTELISFDIYSLEFKAEMDDRSDWINPVKDAKISIPALFKTTLTIEGSPTDTFVIMKGWGKGIVLVNGFNLGRYWSAGPQQTLYVPAAVLKTGTNQIVFFEHEKQGESIVFLDKPILDVNDQSTIQVFMKLDSPWFKKTTQQNISWKMAKYRKQVESQQTTSLKWTG